MWAAEVWVRDGAKGESDLDGVGVVLSSPDSGWLEDQSRVATGPVKQRCRSMSTSTGRSSAAPWQVGILLHGRQRSLEEGGGEYNPSASASASACAAARLRCICSANQDEEW